MHAKDLSAIVKFLSVFVSDDKARPQLCTIHATGDRKSLVATDGHALAALTFKDPLPVQGEGSALSVKGALAVLAAGSPVSAAPYPTGHTFPAWDQVIPAKETTAPKDRRIGFDPSLLGGALEALGKLQKSFKTRRQCVVQAGEDKTAPFRIEAEFPNEPNPFTVTVVVMPMRVE